MEEVTVGSVETQKRIGFLFGLLDQEPDKDRKDPCIVGDRTGFLQRAEASIFFDFTVGGMVVSVDGMAQGTKRDGHVRCFTDKDTLEKLASVANGDHGLMNPLSKSWDHRLHKGLVECDNQEGLVCNTFR